MASHGRNAFRRVDGNRLALGFLADVVVGFVGSQRGGGKHIAHVVLVQALVVFLASFVAGHSSNWLMITALLNGWLAGRITPLLQHTLEGVEG